MEKSVINHWNFSIWWLINWATVDWSLYPDYKSYQEA